MCARILAATLGLVLLAGATACSDSGEPATLPANPGPIAATIPTPDPTPASTDSPTAAPSTPATSPANPATSATSTAPAVSSTPGPWGPPSDCYLIVNDQFRADAAAILTVLHNGGLTRTMAVQALVAKVNSYREMLQRAISFSVDPQFDAALGALRSATDGWVAALQSTNDPGTIEVLIDDPAYVNLWDAVRVLCDN